MSIKKYFIFVYIIQINYIESKTSALLQIATLYQQELCFEGGFQNL